ncbi:DNA-3-methyladenine glycosylase 2 [Microbulbifer halophilus]|uniref:DNA-3-methyladenine glycosylase II n=1 Tax=Microbulbifer halophilus TaxID=453963 RepID=A0ABW5EG31_9GAMM|nr:DNA-3-methyladenine glycosylase 2 [Microbulbifer halophilus]MCW8127994.1 helix-turn-helix domain-containing protein [Microbulbifer halophilus]
MQLDPEICASARLARDRRFDGRFYTAVRTTGIFCRPICPARPPLERNVTYFSTAVEAASAGYRPCLRCRPDAAPGSPAWGLVSTTVERALKLMRSEREAQSIETLADRLGVSSRYLRRLFAEHLGIGPLAVWQAERALFAFGLLQDTNLPIAGIAHEAGFNSLRRFNSVFKQIYRRTPSDVRREGVGRREACEREPRPGDPDAGAHSHSATRLYLHYRPPFHWPQLLAFFRARALAGVEQVAGETYRRSFAVDGVHGLLQVADDADNKRLIVDVSGEGGAALYVINQRLRRLFDLDADTEQIGAVLSEDPLLARELAKTPGVRLPGAWDPFEYALRAILGQQISVAAATTIAGRVAARYGESLTDDAGREYRLFPSAEQLAGADFEGIGLTRARARTLREFVAATLDGRVNFDEAELDEWCAQVTLLPGIGDWTAQYIAMRGLSMPDAFPASDLGILQALGSGGEKAKPKQALARAENWRPWRAYGTLLAWQSLKTGDT